MRNVLKAETLERRFPLLSVENGCIVSKSEDLPIHFMKAIEAFFGFIPPGFGIGFVLGYIALFRGQLIARDNTEVACDLCN